MAYVRITDTLVKDVKRNIAMMSSKAEALYKTDTPEPGTPLYEKIVEAAMASAWSAAPHLRGKLPQCWVRPLDSLYVRFLDDDGSCHITVSLVPAFAGSFEVPPADDRFSYSDRLTVKLSSPEAQDPLIKQWLNEEAYRAEKRREIVIEYREVQHQINAFLRSHPSLNAALKEMPELELYVPASYMDKYRAKAAPRAKPEKSTAVEEIGIDRDKLTALGVSHRVTTSR